MSAVSGPMSAAGGVPRQQRAFKTQDKPDEVRRSNMNAAKAVSDAIRTSLGPKGMDKMVSDFLVSMKKS
jgi:T-complex protein 1 subunit delta